MADTPDDWAESLTISWRRAQPQDSIATYEIWRKVLPEGKVALLPQSATIYPDSVLDELGWKKIGSVSASETVYVDSGLKGSESYAYVVVSTLGRNKVASQPSVAVKPRKQIIKRETLNTLIAVVLFMLTVIMLVEKARRGATLFIINIKVM